MCFLVEIIVKKSENLFGESGKIDKKIDDDFFSSPNDKKQKNNDKMSDLFDFSSPKNKNTEKKQPIKSLDIFGTSDDDRDLFSHSNQQSGDHFSVFEGKNDQQNEINENNVNNEQIIIGHSSDDLSSSSLLPLLVSSFILIFNFIIIFLFYF